MSVATRFAAVAIVGVLAGGALAACSDNGEYECESMALTTVSFVEKGGRGGSSGGSSRSSSGSKSGSSSRSGSVRGGGSKSGSGNSNSKRGTSGGSVVVVGSSHDDCDDD